MHNHAKGIHIRNYNTFCVHTQVPSHLYRRTSTFVVYVTSARALFGMAKTSEVLEVDRRIVMLQRSSYRGSKMFSCHQISILDNI